MKPPIDEGDAPRGTRRSVSGVALVDVDGPRGEGRACHTGGNIGGRAGARTGRSS